MATTYTVKKGDTLWGISQTYASSIAGSNTQAKVNTLVKLNNITDPDYIVVGQVLKLSGTADPVKESTTSRVTMKAFGLQSDTDRTVYATWTWTKSNTDSYEVKWYYATGDGIWFVGNDSSTKYAQSLYTAPNNAIRVKFIVKPVSKTHKVNNKDTKYWTANWSTASYYNFSDNPPTVPSTPNVEIKDYTLTATLDNLNVNADEIQFQIVKDNSTIFKTGKAKITTGHASYSCTVAAGSEYKVRCRAIRDSEYSEWSEYSNNSGTKPSASTGITELKALSKTSIYISWSPVTNAETYDIEYVTDKTYFDSSSEVKTVSVDSVVTHAELTGLESGEQYFFRVRATNEKGSSAWTEIKSITIGTDPVSPTTWSSSTTVIVGDELNLYWVHNTEDGSSETYAELELYINGVKEVYTIKNTASEEEKDKTKVYTINTNEYSEGSVIQWRVRTAGITLTYGDWSVQRTIDIYAPPTLELRITDVNGDELETISSFPFYIHALAGPNTQVPIGYSLTVVANNIYETVNNMGDVVTVNKDEAIYSKHFDINDPLLVEMSAYNINLENNENYTVVCTASMNSGLTVKSTADFDVTWSDFVYEPDAEIGVDPESLIAHIRPYSIREDVLLSVYRREFDGGFTEIAKDLDSNNDTYVTDPHPALDYARYRIVAKAKDTGVVSFYDAPGYPIGEKAVVIQWAEEWRNFDVDADEELEQPPWSGSLLKLPYNIDISESNTSDVAMVEYIGRKRPVTYYGTQLGETATWNMEIVKSDTETLYALRRLAIWMGDVYVREPSGSGYWANIKVSLNQKHLGLTIPVSLSITRVEGGV